MYFTIYVTVQIPLKSNQSNWIYFVFSLSHLNHFIAALATMDLQANSLNLTQHYFIYLTLDYSKCFTWFYLRPKGKKTI